MAPGIRLFTAALRTFATARLMRAALAWDMQAESLAGETPAVRRRWEKIERARSRGASASEAIEGIALAPPVAEGTDSDAPSVRSITEKENLGKGTVSRVLPFAYLALDIVEMILEGRQPPGLTAKRLRGLRDLPLDWAEQRQLLGCASA